MKRKAMLVAVMFFGLASALFAQVPIRPIEDDTETSPESAAGAEAKAPDLRTDTGRRSFGQIEVWEDAAGLHARNKAVAVTLQRKPLVLEVCLHGEKPPWRSASDGSPDLVVAVRGKRFPLRLAEARYEFACFVRVNKTGGFEVLLKDFKSLDPGVTVEVGLRVMLDQKSDAFTVQVMLYGDRDQTLEECRYLYD